MTIKQIAELIGKNKSTFGRWVSQLQNATSEKPTDFTLDETIEILKAG